MQLLYFSLCLLVYTIKTSRQPDTVALDCVFRPLHSLQLYWVDFKWRKIASFAHHSTLNSP